MICMTEKVRENKSAYHEQMKIWECDKRFFKFTGNFVEFSCKLKKPSGQDRTAGGYKKTGGHTSSGFSFMVN